MKKHSDLRITRMSGAQNTFLVVNVFDPEWKKVFSQFDEADKIALAQHLCEGFYGFSTDGLLFVRPEPKFDFAWEFYNSDGSKAEMCGNAARCVTLFYHQKVSSQSPVRFLTGAGEIGGEVLSPDLVRVEMTAVSQTKKMNVRGHDGFFVNTGVPHFVLEKTPDRQLAQSLRKVTDFGPSGANITFVENLAPNSLNAVTFERGVEDYTQACGTGAVAATMYLQSLHGPLPFVDVTMPGGVLRIEKAIEGQRPLLTGPAKIEFEMDHWEMK